MANNVAKVPPDQASQPIANLPATGLEDEAYLVYPRDMADDQDRIRFSLWEIKKTGVEQAGATVSLSEPGYEAVKTLPNQVFLPIQSGISDQNAVNWGAGELNEIQRRLVDTSLNYMNEGSFSKLGEQLYGLGKDVLGSKLGNVYAAEQAVGVQGLLSRVTGNVLNPNLELLFQGPTLRPFQFQFKLSPRNEPEATTVKQIIKFFKKNMAVKNKGGLFLNAPYVFQIEYISPEVQTLLHPSIGLIKRCALQSCTVDYTPLGSYMTYNDVKKTMVSYNISLQFQEITPIYDSDYKNIETFSDVGF